MVNVTNNNFKYVIAEHIPISVDYIWRSNFKNYFGLDCIKDLLDLLEIKTGNGFKCNEKFVINNEDKFYR